MCDFLLLACVWLSGCLKVCPVVLLRGLKVSVYTGAGDRGTDWSVYWPVYPAMSSCHAYVVICFTKPVWENGFVEPMGTHAPCAERGS